MAVGAPGVRLGGCEMPTVEVRVTVALTVGEAAPSRLCVGSSGVGDSRGEAVLLGGGERLAVAEGEGCAVALREMLRKRMEP